MLVVIAVAVLLISLGLLTSFLNILNSELHISDPVCLEIVGSIGRGELEILDVERNETGIYVFYEGGVVSITGSGDGLPLTGGGVVTCVEGDT